MGKLKIDKEKAAKILFKSLAIILLIGIIGSTAFATFSILLFRGIENTIRFLGIGVLINILAIVLVIEFKLWKKKSLKFLSIFFLIILIYMGGLIYTSSKLVQFYNTLSKITETELKFYSTSIVVLEDSSLNSINDVKIGIIGMIEDEDSIEGFEIPTILINEYEFDRRRVALYDNYVELIADLLDGSIDSAFLPTSYPLMFESIEEFEELEGLTKIIYTRELERIEKEEPHEQISLDQPFTILFIGTNDFGNRLLSSYNSNALMLLTFNPKTLNVTSLSIPRDSYITMPCMNNRKNKMSHAGWGGDRCVVRTLEGFFGIKIDYFFRLNMTATVDFVEELGGIEVDIPYAFCEQDSRRRWGEHTIFVDQGLQHLNGEQALAFTRKRKVVAIHRNNCPPEYTQHASYWNDFIRGQSQQAVFTAIMNKAAKEVRSFSKVEDLLSIISQNSQTNMNMDTLFSLYNLGKNSVSKVNNHGQAFTMQRLKLNGHSAMIYDFSFLHNSGNRRILYNFVIYDNSRDVVVRAMEENLGIRQITPVRTFSFSINNEFKETVIGENVRGRSSLVLLPNFIGQDIERARTFGANNNLNIVVNYVDGRPGQFVGQIVSQSIPASVDLAFMPANRALTLSVVSRIVSGVEPPEPDDDDDDDDDDPID